MAFSHVSTTKIKRFQTEDQAWKRWTEHQASMRGRRPSAAQLQYLEALGHFGEPPKTMGSASELIGRLRTELRGGRP